MKKEELKQLIREVVDDEMDQKRRIAELHEIAKLSTILVSNLKKKAKEHGLID